MSDRPIPPPNCPEAFRVTNHIPMAHVADVDRSVQFYSLLGFTCDSRFSAPDGITNFASLSSGRANLMLARADAPVVPNQQAVLFYMYSQDVMGLRMHLLAHGLDDGGKPPSECDLADGAVLVPDRPTVFRPTYPSYMPEGEIRIHDPDGYCILVGRMDR